MDNELEQRKEELLGTYLGMCKMEDEVLEKIRRDKQAVLVEYINAGGNLENVLIAQGIRQFLNVYEKAA